MKNIYKMVDLYYSGSITSQKLVAFIKNNSELSNEIIYNTYHNTNKMCKYCGNERKFTGFKIGYRCTKECYYQRKIKPKITEPLTKELIISNVTKQNNVSRKFLNFYNITEEKCYIEVYGSKKCKFCSNDAEFIKWCSGYNEVCVNKNCKRKLRKERTQATNIKKYGCKNVSSVKEIQSKKSKTFKINYGVDNISQLSSTIIKMRKTNEASGRWIPYESKPDKKHYEQKVRKLTEKQNLSKLENCNLRGPVTENGYHLDHKVSISEGFKNNIPIYIIASIENLCFIPAKENQSKNFHSSISINKLCDNVLSTDKNLLA